MIVYSSIKFIHISVGYPGIHDPTVLRLSGLYDLEQNEQMLSSPTKVINVTEDSPLIVRESAHPLLKWLIIPFPARGAPSQV